MDFSKARFIEVDGIRTRYFDAGEGETAVQVELSHAAIVKTDGSSTQAGVSPTGSSIGFIGGLSVVWRTNFAS